MKKLVSLALAVLLTIIIPAATLAAPQTIDLGTMTLDELNALRQEVDAQIKILNNSLNPSSVDGVLAEGDIGNYHIAILGASMTKNYEKKDTIAIKCEWSHTNDEAKNFTNAIRYKAYQDGSQIGSTILDFDEEGRYIKSGAIRQIEFGFVLANLTSPVEIEITEWMSFSSKKEKVEYTFTLPLQ
ncbi:hypothetical protein AGMMS49992_27040 [Clostridia bacterium]|nr:hypothetical protein AGMMS49992_27040 [Clostridia bacterium]